jgi:L-fuconolactonase
LTDAIPFETILEPNLPIVDPHHHLWDWSEALLANRPHPGHGYAKVSRRAMRYLLHELLADLNTGHNIRATVFVQCRAMYKADGPAAFKPIGETEFVNGMAAMSASGLYGEVRACAGIVGHVDLTNGAAVSEVLEAQLRAGGGRFRGIRHSASYDADSAVLGPLSHTPPDLYPSTAFRVGSCTYPMLWNAFKRLAQDYSAAEKTALFSENAKRIYRLDI